MFLRWKIGFWRLLYVYIEVFFARGQRAFKLVPKLIKEQKGEGKKKREEEEKEEEEEKNKIETFRNELWR